MKKDIYVITNIITGMQYVGQSSNAQKRFLAHKQAKDGTVFHQAIRNYGPENFFIEVLEEQIENFNEREKYWIKKLNTLYPTGYNMTKGGEGYPHLNGELSYQSKLTNVQVNQIIDLLLNSSLSQEQIGEKFNVTQEIISDINRGKTYFRTNCSYPIRSTKEKEQEASQIISEILNNKNLTLKQIAKNHPNFSYFMIKAINEGKSYRKKDLKYPLAIETGNKLKENDIIAIKSFLEHDDLTIIDIANFFHVNKQAIEKINQGEAHFHPSWDYPLRKHTVYKKNISIEDLNQIKFLLKNSDLSFREIARRMNIKSHSTISNINSGKTKAYFEPNENYPIRK